MGGRMHDTRMAPVGSLLAFAALCLIATAARIAPARAASVLEDGRVGKEEREFARGMLQSNGAPPSQSLRKSDADRKLWRASIDGNADAAKDALQEMADTEARFGKRGRTPIMIAALKGHLEVVELLIAAGADVKAYSTYGSNPVILASQASSVEVLKRLLWAGASPHSSSLRRKSATEKAPQATDETELERALNNAGLAVEGSTERGPHPLMVGAYFGHPDIVETLLDFGARVNQTSDTGATALHVSGATIGRGSVDVTRLILKERPDLEKRDALGQTPFIASAFFGNPGVAAVLLEAGADASAKSYDGKGAAESICDCKAFGMLKINICSKKDIVSGCDRKKEIKALKKLLSG